MTSLKWVIIKNSWYSWLFTNIHSEPCFKTKTYKLLFWFYIYSTQRRWFFIRERKISQENLKFRVLVMFSRKNEFFTNLAILIGCRLFNWITKNDREKIWKWPRKDDFWSKMFKSTKMFKISSQIFREFRGYVISSKISLKFHLQNMQVI